MLHVCFLYIILSESKSMELVIHRAGTHLTRRRSVAWIEGVEVFVEKRTDTQLGHRLSSTESTVFRGMSDSARDL